MTFHLGVDMDGVLLDNTRVWCDIFNAHYTECGHAEWCPREGPSKWNFFRETCATCWSQCLHDPETLDRTYLMAYAHAELTKLAKRGVKLSLISHREPEFAFRGRKRLEELHVLDLFSNTSWSWRQKSDTTKALGCNLLVDDSPYVAIDLQTRNPSCSVLCFAAPHNREVVGPRALHWPSVTEYIETYFGHVLA